MSDFAVDHNFYIGVDLGGLGGCNPSFLFIALTFSGVIKHFCTVLSYLEVLIIFHLLLATFLRRAFLESEKQNSPSSFCTEVINITTTEHTPTNNVNISIPHVNQTETPTVNTTPPNEPFQPANFNYPARTYGNDKRERYFQSSWFVKFPWLHYDAHIDKAFCFTCMNAIRKNMISSTKSEDAFTATGFSNWKKALQKNQGFAKHENSDCHSEATARLVTGPAYAKGDIGDLLNEQHSTQKAQNQTALRKILENLRFLARQSLPLRGNWKSETAGEEDSNF